MNQTLFSFSSVSLVVALAGAVGVGAARAGETIKEGEMSGYRLVPNDRGPPSFNAGFFLYVAAGPLSDQSVKVG